ncbi:MAG: radical SAM protein [Flavobacteriales bacterium]|nr:radical SAM protein [Flavobacteriales bacterium]
MLLLIPPLTQLNTPYPATAYLKGFLDAQGIEAQQGDLGLDLFLKVFTSDGLTSVFNEIEQGEFQLEEGLTEMVLNKRSYISSVETVIRFLQHKETTIAFRISKRSYLPEGPRFEVIEDLAWYFGTNSIQDQARYLCSLYLEDLVDLIAATVGPYFGVSKYAERIARTATSFGPIDQALEAPANYIDTQLIEVAKTYFENDVPHIVGFTVPFGGNLYGALKVAQWIKKDHPNTKVLLGGGYANTELRDLSDARVFNYVDYITLDDGEGPILALKNHIEDPVAHPNLKRTFLREAGKVVYKNDVIGGEFGHSTLPAPSYKGLRTADYLSMFDMPNPMHRMWNDGRWNKLTIAHGCYWKKCSFCDVSLDYIGRFEQSPAKELVDKMEALIAETGETGFHFVDEAAPPLAMRDLALEILKRGLQVTWWTNIRFEKTFTPDLCKLLAASGCIAVTGGLEVASDRLLKLMEKGVTVEQVARVCKGFRDSGILVHAYLMYGFPTETDQETVDSLDVVRQLFEEGLIHSGFWHQFAMTVHSPVGMNPEKYQVERIGPTFEGFANNDLYHNDPTGADHQKYSEGLSKALYNYMHDNGFDLDLREFFDFKIPRTTVSPHLIRKSIKGIPDELENSAFFRLMWNEVGVQEVEKTANTTTLLFVSSTGSSLIAFPHVLANWMMENQAEFDLRQGGMALEKCLAQVESLTSLKWDAVVTQQWWRKWRNEVIWRIRV